MNKIGILLHVHEVSEPGWESIAWGSPQDDKLGSLPRLCQLLLTSLQDVRGIKIVVFSGPSQKDGLSEGAYTKQFLLNNLGRLSEFPSLRELVADSGDLKILRAQIEGIVLGKDIVRTSDEIAAAVPQMTYPEIGHVIQIACASQAPRCVQLQTFAQAQGLLPKGQTWSVVPSDMFYDGAKPEDVVIFERPHLSYDPMTGFSPSAPEALGRYFGLSAVDKQAFLAMAEQFIAGHSR